MRIINHRVMYSSIFYILVVILLVISKPKCMFDENGELKSFGVGEKCTILHLGVLVVALAIVSFYLFAFIDIFFKK